MTVTLQPASALLPALQARDTTTLRLVAHGSPDPRHAASVHRLAARIEELTGARVRACFLEHDLPRATEALLPPIRETVDLREDREFVLPLLLTGGVHWRRDVPPIVGHHGGRIRLLPALPPVVLADPVARLVSAHPQARRVVLASAGSSQPDAAHRFEELAERVSVGLRERGRRPTVEVALTQSAIAGPGDGTVVVPVLVADGVFADRIRSAAAAIRATTTAVVGDTWAGAAAIAMSLTDVALPGPGLSG